MHNPTPHAIIIGAGIAGPAVALFLKLAGISSTIYEAQTSVAGIGTGLQIAPNGMQVLAALGLAGKIIEHGNIVSHMCFRNQQGKVLARFRNGRKEKYGQPAVFIARSTFHKLLIEETSSQGIRIEYGKRLKDIFDVPGKVLVVRFEDGTTTSGDFLIGADGTHSRTRGLILTHCPHPRFMGLLNLGGFAPLSAVPAHLRAEMHDMTMTFGRQGFFGYGICSTKEASAWTWWSNLPVETEMSHEKLSALTTDELQTRLLEMYKGWHEPIEHLLRHTGLIFKTNMHEVATIPSWYRGRTVLIGDAAHAMSPHAGQGSSIALEDAMYLAKLLRQYPDQPEPVFAQFEQERRARVEKVNARARHNGHSRKARSPLSARFRDVYMSFSLKAFGEQRMDWMYRYKIQWDE